MQPQAGISGGQRFRILHSLLELRAQRFPIADEAQAHLIAMQIRHFAHQRIEEQAHEHADFIGRPPPVLAAEGEQRQVADFARGAFFDDLAHDFDAGAVSRDARHAARAGPAAIAVHDDCDMLRRVGHTRFQEMRVRLRSDLHELLFLVGHGVIDIGDMLVGQFLNVVLPAPIIVLRDELFLEHFLQFVVMISRRTPRTATRAFSASAFTTLMMSRRLSSVSAGM